MQRTEQYRLTIAQEGHRSYEFFFSNPPSRQDFFVAMANIPWTQCWEADLFPAVRDKSFDWVYLTIGRKRVSNVAVAESGDQFTVTVDRDDRFINGIYIRDFLRNNDVSRLTCRLKDSEAAAKALDDNELAVLNISVEENVAMFDAGRLWLERNGYKKPSRKKK